LDTWRFDEKGYLYIVDCKNDMIIISGENIFPNGIEDVVYRHPAVERRPWLAVASLNGVRSVAAVKLRPGHAAGEAGPYRALQDIPGELQDSQEDRLPLPNSDVIVRKDPPS
jgi:acyl-CoA synthetase (AMP-forming)/AMP-acid ligase II